MTNQWISSIKFNLFGKALFESKMKGNDFFAPLVGKRVGMQGIAFKSPAHMKSFFNGLEYASQSGSKAFTGCHMMSWQITGPSTAMFSVCVDDEKKYLATATPAFIAGVFAKIGVLPGQPRDVAAMGEWQWGTVRVSEFYAEPKAKM